MTRPEGVPAEGEVVERDVEQLRADLGHTVEELVHRVDVPQRLREKRAETTERVQAEVARARETVAQKAPAVQDALRESPAVVGGVLAALLLLCVRTLVARRRARRKEDTGGTG
jgi:hypothetical protein